MRRLVAEGAWVTGAPRELDMRDLAAVVWATGFRRDFRYIDAHVFDLDGEPVHRRGVTAAAGLYFLGLRWQYRRSSSFIDGVGADAEHLAARISADAAFDVGVPALAAA